MTTLTPAYHAVSIHAFSYLLVEAHEKQYRNHIAPTTTVCMPNFVPLRELKFRNLGFDLRPFLYPSRFPWQFKKIDEVAAVLPDRSNQPVDKTKTE